jgi:hypothetical protein
MHTTVSPVVGDQRIESLRTRTPRREHPVLPARPVGRGAHQPSLPWRCRGYPATTAEESAFSLELAQMANAAPGRDERPGHARSEITAVLNALRGGLTAQELVQRLPGLDPIRLLDAYCQLERLRSRSVQAWEAIVAGGSVATLRQHARYASDLLPVFVDRLICAAASGPKVYSATVHRLDAAIAATGDDLLRLEAALTRGGAQAIAVGLYLFNPDGDSITGRDDHLSHRVGTLTSARVAALLGERPAQGSRPGG